MNPNACQRIAERISTLLRAELGEPVDVPRMLNEPLYARDVLLVCDAHAGGELAVLSHGYRLAAAARPDHPGSAGRRAPSSAGRTAPYLVAVDGHAAARPPPDTGPGVDTRPPGQPAPPAPSARSTALGRWFGRPRWPGR